MQQAEANAYFSFRLTQLTLLQIGKKVALVTTGFD